MRVRLQESCTLNGLPSYRASTLDGRDIVSGHIETTEDGRSVLIEVKDAAGAQRQRLTEAQIHRIRKMIAELFESDRRRLERERRKEKLARMPTDPEAVIGFLRRGR